MVEKNAAVLHDFEKYEACTAEVCGKYYSKKKLSVGEIVLYQCNGYLIGEPLRWHKVFQKLRDGEYAVEGLNANQESVGAIVY